MTRYEKLPKPRKVSRLKQLSKSNRLMRRFYSGKTPTPQTIKPNPFNGIEAIY